MNKIDALLDILYKIYAILKYFQLQDAEGKLPDDSLQMTRQQVKDYLKISESTYKRKVKQGTLTPVKMPGGDRFYKYQLEDELRESVRRGRI
ncbi:DNA-binding protein [Pedobacter aquatilis]|uniref:DNA-binding protein n=1 Tax=Pedobacter aquatilis TaxID=351343 RepID=UPI00292E1A9A|nr:DNA-binding protein [Pedobacter aquatilis]